MRNRMAVEKVLLAGAAFGERHALPFGDELLGGHHSCIVAVYKARRECEARNSQAIADNEVTAIFRLLP